MAILDHAGKWLRWMKLSEELWEFDMGQDIWKL